MEIKLFDYLVVKPFAFLGLESQIFDVHLDTLIYTWVGMAVLISTAVLCRYYMKKNPLSVGSILLERVMRVFIELCTESIGEFRYDYFVFIASIFFFTLSCNMVSLLPFVEEASNDLNTTLAIALCSFFYVQYHHIKSAGIVGYIKSYFEPMFFMMPLEIIGKLSSIVSMSFRLFGNILGGSVIFLLIVQAIGVYKGPFMLSSVIILGLYMLTKRFINLSQHKIIDVLFKSVFGFVFFLAGLQMFFGIFEALVQAFVLTMLSLTYLAIAVSESESAEEA